MSDYKPLNDRAYEHLRAMIYNRELEFRRVYSETRLAAALSVSRTPIRDALNRLAQERYIDILPNRGFMLHTPTQADIVEGFHVRMMMEGYCAGIVARDYPSAPARAVIGRMEDALDRQQRLLEDDSVYSLSQFWQDDLAFHRALLEYMGISALLAQYDRIMYTFMPHHLIRRQDGGQMEPQVLERHRSTLVEHRAITEALKGRDPERLQEAIRAHLDSSLRALYERMEG